MRRVLLAFAGVLAAVAVAIPAASAASYQYSFTVRAGGFVMDNPSGGTIQSLGKFEINLKAGPGHKVTYVDKTAKLSFHSTSLTKLTYTFSSVKIVGVGMVNGRRVNFTAIASDHPANVDGFKISWNHMAAHGGNVLTGNVHIRQIKLS